MRADFQFWLEQQDIDAAAVTSQVNRASRVEKTYGNLDRHYAKDRLQSLIDTLRYTPEDERKRRPNPTKLGFEGNIRNNLTLFRYAIEQYRRFRDGEADVGLRLPADHTETGAPPPAGGDDEGRQRSILDRDMQMALRTYGVALGGAPFAEVVPIRVANSVMLFENSRPGASSGP